MRGESRKKKKEISAQAVRVMPEIAISTLERKPKGLWTLLFCLKTECLAMAFDRAGEAPAMVETAKISFGLLYCNLHVPSKCCTKKL